MPTSIAFLGEDDFLVLEKDSGRVVRVTNGANQGAVLDLSVKQLLRARPTGNRLASGFSWKHGLAPAAIGFIEGRGLGPQFAGSLFVGMSVPEPLGGPLFRLNLTGNRKKIGVDDPRLEDRVADNTTFHDMTESESLLAGTGFGVVTDIETGPDGHLYVVSLSQGTVYEISGRR